MDYLLDTHVWYAISFAIFAFIIWKYGGPSLIAYIDNRIKIIEEELQTSENLRTEAQELLAQYQRKHRDAVQEAQKIIDDAEKHVAEIKAKAEEDIAETLARREKQLEQRIAQMQINAIDEIKAHTAELAIEATAEIIANKLDKKGNQGLMDQSIKAISLN